jgi:hypothetical protein
MKTKCLDHAACTLSLVPNKSWLQRAAVAGHVRRMLPTHAYPFFGMLVVNFDLNTNQMWLCYYGVIK